MLLIAIPAGLLTGLLLGTLGGGGSILTVPVLVYLLRQSPHAATAGSLLIVGTTAAVGMIAHRRAGRVRAARAGRRPGASVLPGARPLPRGRQAGELPVSASAGAWSCAGV